MILRKLFLIGSFLVILFFISLISGKKAFAAGEFGNTNPNANQSNYNGYNMGYRFQPKTNGNITQLWCGGYGGSTSTVRLWDEANTSTPLASVSINCASGSWVSANITPVAVSTSKTYRVAQYGSSAYYTGVITTPVNITILDGVYISGTSAYPSNLGGGYIYGYADVTFASSNPTVSTTGIWSYQYNYIQPYGVVNPSTSGTIYYGAAYGNSNSSCSSLPYKTGFYGPLAANSGNNTVYPSFTTSPSTPYYTCIYAYDSSTGQYYYSSTTSPVTTPAAPTYTLSVTNNNTSFGTVTSNAGGINCGATCSYNYSSGTSMTLTATPNSGYSFTGWGGACVGTGTCSITMDSSKSVTASFISGSLQTKTFNYTGAQQTWTVPSGVSSVTLEAWGAQGGQGYGYSGNPGGLGGYVKGNLSVSPGQTLYIYVGGAGQDGVPNTVPAGGFGGGGGASQSNPWIGSLLGGGGGGASDVRSGGNALSNRVIVAGGGGGGGSYTNAAAGGGGYPNGIDGAYISSIGWYGGTGGTQSAGGTGYGTSGSLGVGGTGATNYCGGGGGGGYYGGGSSGGSCNSSGAGGGSSYLGGVTSTSYTNATQSGSGKVIITYIAPSTSTLTVTNPGSTGTITDGVTPHIYCPSTCSYDYTNGTSVTLYTTPASGYTFSSWTAGPCAGSTNSTCTFTINSSTTVTASFTTNRPTNVTTNAVDYIQVNENQAIINGAANPNNFASTGWFRYVASTNPGTCNDTFGTRLPSSGGYDLGSSGTLQNYSQQTPATLTANTTYYYCAIANNSNGTTPASNVLSFITAPPPPAFTSPLPSATVVSPGNSSISWTNTSANGAGYYSLRIWDKTLNPTAFGSNYSGGLSALCAANAANTTNDVCYNTPNASTTTYSYTFTAGHTYQIWVHSRNSTTGAWSSAGPSTSNMITVTANYPLNVSKTLGTGTSASVTSLDGFINCGATCSYSYATNASVKLTAVPDNVTQLNGWSGVICTGAGESQTTDTCTFNVGDISGSNGTVTANFIKKTFVLTAAINGGAAGLGSGTVQTLTSVSGSPDGFINCGSTCAHTYDINTTVYLKETPDSTATFAGWSGISCLGGDQTAEVCAVYMDAAKTATANFNSIGYTGDATFYFGTPGQTCNPGNAANTTPALEVVIITGSTASPTVSKYFFDPCNRVGGSTGIVTALDSTTGLYQGVTFAYKATVPAISHGLIMKVIPLYNSSKVGVKGTDIFPPQGKVIQSTGSSGDSARKVIYYESYPQIPNEIFPYSILSQ